MFALEVESNRRIRSGVILTRKCERCKAVNRIPLDKLSQGTYDRGNGIIE